MREYESVCVCEEGDGRMSLEMCMIYGESWIMVYWLEMCHAMLCHAVS